MTSAFQLRQASRIVLAGGVIAYPTEGVFGLGCDPLNADAVAKVLAIKGRPWQAGLILIAADLSQLDDWIDPDTDERQQLDRAPAGPVTWIVGCAASAPAWITGGRTTLAVRVTDHPIAAALCRLADSPLVSTSANRRGRRPAKDLLGVRRAVGTETDLIVPGEIGTAAGPSEIRVAATGRVLRPAAS